MVAFAAQYILPLPPPLPYAGRVRNASILVQLIILSHSHLFAQVSNRTGAFSGRLLDPQAVPIAGALIRATSLDTNLLRETRSDDQGAFLIANLNAGPYSLTIQAPGFTGKEFPEVLIASGQTLFEQITLRLASVEQKLDVVEQIPILDIASASPAVTFGYERMEHSSSQGRNYVNFILTAPGMTPASGQSTGRSPAASWNVNNDSGFTSGGIRSRNNSVSIDGTDNRDETTGAIRVSVPLEMIQELRISANTISAELGGAAGGVVNIVTRSGSNTLHGHGEFLLQNEALNARNPEFAIPGRPRLRRTQPGASAGGPLARDRTFFALAAEAYREDCDEWSEAFATLRPGNTFRAGERNYQYSGKLQHIFNRTHTGALRYAYSLGRVREGVQGIENHSDYSARGSSRIADHALVANLSSAFSASLVNSLTLQYGRRGAGLTPNSRDPFVEIPGILSFGQGPRLDQQRAEAHLEAVNGLTFLRGRNALSFGISLHHVTLDSRLANRFGGISLFPTLAAWQANQPDFRLRALGSPATSIQTTPLGFWLNNRWQARHGLTLEAGLRYDYQILPAAFRAPRANFSPRFGIAYSPGATRKSVFRLGLGLFFDRYPLAFLNEAVQKDGRQAWEQFEYPTLKLSFRAIYRPASHLPATYGAKLTAGFERQLNSDTTLSVDFSRVRGLHLPRIRNTNGGLPALFTLEQNATSSYSGATVTLSRKMTSEFGYLLSYTASRTLDNGSDFDEHPQNPLNLAPEWARSRQHQRYRLTATGLFEVEALEKLSPKLAHIHIVPTLAFGSGRPLPALESADLLRTAAYPLSARPAGLGRNPFTTPANSSLDARVFKEIHWEEKHLRLQAGVEAYNLLNHSNPIRFIPYYRANYADPIEFSPARQLQLFLHMEF